MPRKQRFKPSRKPKPIQQTEDAVIGRQPSHAPANNDNVGMRDMPPSRDDDSLEPSTDQGSR
jgi:hypothetical protein